MVPKRDATIRICIDFRKLNEITMKDAYPLPRIGQTQNALQNAEYFSLLDVASGYWQVPVAEKDRQNSIFCTPEGGFQKFLNINCAVWISECAGNLERLLNEIFREDSFKHVLYFLDDLLVYSETPAEHSSTWRNFIKDCARLD